MTTISLYAQPNLTSGIDDALLSTAQSVPTFPVMILVFIFGMILLGGSVNQKRRTGTVDMPMWAVLAGLGTTLTALVMSLGDGIIDLTTLGIVVAVTIMSGVWFFLSKTRGEQ